MDFFGSMDNLRRAHRKSKETCAAWEVCLSKKRLLVPEASIDFSEIDTGNLKELEEERDARNAESRVFRANYLAKLTAYPKSGPLGSVRTHVVVGAEELYQYFQYLHNPESRRATRWEKDSICEFARSQGAKLDDYEPTKRRRCNFGET